MKITLDSSELTRLRDQTSNFDFKTELDNQKQHYGLRKGKIHLIIGTPGGGKSTYRNTMLLDFLMSNPDKKAYLYLSEESLDDFKRDLARCRLLANHSDRIEFFSEQDNPLVEGINNMANLLEEVCRPNIGLFVFDNITTSELYPDSFREQGEFSKKLKAAVSKMDFATVIFAHTAGDVKISNRQMIDQNQVRGSKRIVNLSEFLYILQSFYICEEVYSTLRIVKHRGMPAELAFWAMPYDKTNRIYRNLKELNYETFRELFKKQL